MLPKSYNEALYMKALKEIHASLKQLSSHLCVYKMKKKVTKNYF